MNKKFVVDTNVFIDDPDFCSRKDYAENEIIIPITVIEELDKLKSRQDEVGANARLALKKVELQLDNNENIRVFKKDIKNIFPENKNDNLIVSCANYVQNDDEKSEIVLLSNDAAVRLKCKSSGIKTEKYESKKIVSSENEMYTGVVTFSDVAQDLIERIYKDKFVDIPDEMINKVYPNQIVVLKTSQSQSVIVRRKGKDFKKIEIDKNGKSSNPVFGLIPKNKEQYFAVDLLLDPDVRLVTLTGKAGCGKTLVALAAGLHQLDKAGTGIYEKLVVTRPVQPVGKDIGFLPGTLQEKLEPWLSPIKDNFSFLVSNKTKEKKKKKSDAPSLGDPYLDLLWENGNIEMEAISYIRGRSIPNSFLIIDEAQNLSIHELKTIITRAGENTKIVLTGDVEQIDNPHVDVFSNGLTTAIEKFKNQEIAGHITFLKGERSELATIASSIL